MKPTFSQKETGDILSLWRMQKARGHGLWDHACGLAFELVQNDSVEQTARHSFPYHRSFNVKGCRRPSQNRTGGSSGEGDREPSPVSPLLCHVTSWKSPGKLSFFLFHGTNRRILWLLLLRASIMQVKG